MTKSLRRPELDDEPTVSGSSTPAVNLPPKTAARTKWAGEDEEEDEVGI